MSLVPAARSAWQKHPTLDGRGPLDALSDESDSRKVAILVAGKGYV